LKQSKQARELGLNSIPQRTIGPEAAAAAGGRPLSAAPSPHSRALQLLGAKLAAAGLTDGQLLEWLKHVEAVPSGIFALQSIPTRRLEIILENWDAVRAQLL